MFSSDNLATLAPFLIVAAGAIGFPITALLLRRYRSAVVRLMSVRTAEPDHETRKTQPPVSAAPTPQVRKRVTRRLTLHVAITIGAGLFVGLTYALMFAVWNDLEYDPIQLAFLAVMFSWPAVPGVWIATDGDRRWSGGVLAAYVLAALTLPSMTGAGPLAGVVAWAWFNGLPTIVAGVFFTRSFRAIGICVLGVALAALIGAETSLTTLESDAAARLVVELGFSAGIRNAGLLLMIVAAAGFIAAGAMGWLVLSRLGRWYANQRFSDHMLLLGSLCFVFCIDYVAVVAGSDPRALAVALLLFASLAVGSLVFYRVLVGNRTHPTGLLLLRVFDHDRNSEKLLNRIASRWRFVGPVRLIAGPDLASSTIEPDEFLTFMSGRLRRLFIPDHDALQQRLAGLPPHTDPDGRYRIDELFCFDTTWRAAVDALISRSDVVLLDLRGFTTERTGAAEELELLGHRGLFDRTVVTIDDRADLEHIESIIAASARDRPSIVTVSGNRPDRAVGLLLDRTRAPAKSAN